MKLAQTKQDEVTPVLDTQQLINNEQALKQVSEIAYFKAEDRNFAPGHELNDWLEAEQQLNLKLKEG